MAFREGMGRGQKEGQGLQIREILILTVLYKLTFKTNLLTRNLS